MKKALVGLACIVALICCINDKRPGKLSKQIIGTWEFVYSVDITFASEGLAKAKANGSDDPIRIEIKPEGEALLYGKNNGVWSMGEVCAYNVNDETKEITVYNDSNSMSMTVTEINDEGTAMLADRKNYYYFKRVE